MDQTEQAKETHRMEIVNDIYKKLHDLDYFLLRYGPKDVAKYVEDDSTVWYCVLLTKEVAEE